MIDKKKTLAALIEQTDNLLETAITEWQLIPHSRFARKPSPEVWSANECLQHLNSYGRYYLPEIEKAMSNDKVDAKVNFTPGWLGNYFTKLMTPKGDGSLTKMKSPKDHAPTYILETHLVISEFIDQQEKLLSLLRTAASANWDRRVPISLTKMIRLKLGDVLMFYTTHQQRHFLQAKRALSTTEIGSK